MKANIIKQRNPKAIFKSTSAESQPINFNSIAFKGSQDENMQQARRVIVEHMGIAAELDKGPKENVMFMSNNKKMIIKIAEAYGLNLDDKVINKFIVNKMVKQDIHRLIARFSSWVNLVTGVVDIPSHLFTEELGQSFIKYCQRITYLR